MISATVRRRTALALALVLATFSLAAQDAPKPAAKTIVIVRHGHYVADATDSSPGPGLSPLGVAQAQLVAARLAGIPGGFDAIIASPMTRAQETAKVIAAVMPRVPFSTDAKLAECTPASRRKEILEREKPEDMKACAAQLDALFAERFVPASGSPRREMLVCHGNVTRYLVTRALGVDPAAWLEMSFGHASITQILVEPDGRFKVIAGGDIGHIPPNLQTGATGMASRSLEVPR